MQEDIDTTAAVSRAIQRLVRKGRDAEYTLANGIVLKIKPVPPYLLTALLREFPDPEPPVVMIEDKEREEPNPNDPRYIQALADNEFKKTKAVSDLVLGVGTEFISAPDGMSAPEDDAWVQNFETIAKITGKDIDFDREDPILRYIAWLRYYAIESSTDLAITTALTYQLTGIQEGEVEEILTAFQGGEGWGTDTSGNVAPVSKNGNQPNRASRRARPRN